MRNARRIFTILLVLNWIVVFVNGIHISNAIAIIINAILVIVFSVKSIRNLSKK